MMIVKETLYANNVIQRSLLAAAVEVAVIDRVRSVLKLHGECPLRFILLTFSRARSLFQSFRLLCQAVVYKRELSRSLGV